MIDITRALAPGHPNWPGDHPFTLEQTAVMGQGSSVNLMRFSTSTHCGTHLDAPFHYHPRGGRIASVPLDLLIGEACLVDASVPGEVSAAVLEGLSELPPRILFFTGQPGHWDAFPKSFTPLAPELIHHLADRGVRLIGTDGPSVDPFTSKELPAHRACGERDIAIVEGLRLDGVGPGRYRLICLPLNLPEADASPVRALLEPL